MTNSLPESLKREFRWAMLYKLIELLGDAGKIKVQKLAYFLQESFHVPMGYAFFMHYYGPFSEEVENDLAKLRAMGYITSWLDPEGYGFHLKVASGGERRWKELLGEYQGAVEKIVTLYGDLDATGLELRATILCVWRSSTEDVQRLRQEVRAWKPKFSFAEIQSAFEELQNARLLN
ncbi:MAG: hypothetical protein ACE5H0_14670 [Bacteroidota bacterium]